VTGRGWTVTADGRTRSEIAKGALARPGVRQKMRESHLRRGTRPPLSTGRHHSAQTRARIGAALSGHVVSSETRARISASLRGSTAPTWPHVPSCLSGLMVGVFLSEFPDVQTEVPFGQYRVDAYLPPPYHLAFEADGAYWHARTERERPGYYARRDMTLRERYGLAVIRITEQEILEAAGRARCK